MAFLVIRALDINGTAYGNNRPVIDEIFLMENSLIVREYSERNSK